jgi:hypothetical protein
MDSKVLDEAVEVALRVRPFAESKTSGRSMLELIDTATDEDAEAAMRAALLAAMPVLLGPRVGWMWPQSRYIYSNVDVRLLDGADTSKAKPVYAPSLGEGDGR